MTTPDLTPTPTPHPVALLEAAIRRFLSDPEFHARAMQAIQLVRACYRDPGATTEYYDAIAAGARAGVIAALYIADQAPSSRSYVSVDDANRVLAEERAAVASALAKLRVVEEMAEEHLPVPGEDHFAEHRISRDMCSCGDQFYDECEMRLAIRRILDAS